MLFEDGTMSQFSDPSPLWFPAMQEDFSESNDAMMFESSPSVPMCIVAGAVDETKPALFNPMSNASFGSANSSFNVVHRVEGSSQQAPQQAHAQYRPSRIHSRVVSNDSSIVTKPSLHRRSTNGQALTAQDFSNVLSEVFDAPMQDAR